MGTIDGPALVGGAAGSVADDTMALDVLQAVSAAAITRPRINCRTCFISRETSEIVWVRRKSG